MKKIIPVIIASLIVVVSLFGCAQDSGNTDMTVMRKTYIFVMNTDARLTVYDYFVENGENNDELIRKFNGLCEETGNLIYELENYMSVNIQTSDISRFNTASAGEKVEISDHTYSVLNTAKYVYGLTEGYYNPAVYYSLSSYGFNGAAEMPPQSVEELPSDEEIAKYVELSSHFDELELIASDGRYYAVKPAFTVTLNGQTLSMQIDLGGVAKGYAVDRVNALMAEYGFEYGNFDFGLSSIAFRKYPDDDLSMVLQLSSPRRSSPSDPVAYVSTTVKDVCVSSSADTENYFLLDTDGDGVEERFCHVFDPTTGRPVQTGVMSATVIGGSAAENDAFTTAIMAMGANKAQKFIEEKLTDRRVVFAFSYGEKLNMYTNMKKNEYVVLDKRYLGENSLSAADIAAIVIACGIFGALTVCFVIRKKTKNASGNRNVS